MNRIDIDHTLPRVFAQRADIQSDVWQQSVTLQRGEFYLLEAASGTGKTSLCSYLIGYRHDYEGRILFDGKDISQLRTADWVALRQHSLSSLFQELRLSPELTAMENVELKNRLLGHKKRAQLLEWFDALGIADKADTPVGRMSFGQQQRVALIRALAQPFDFLLADEPISHLDDANAAIMAEIIRNEAQQQGAGVVVTSIGKHLSLPYDKVFRL